MVNDDMLKKLGEIFGFTVMREPVGIFTTPRYFAVGVSPTGDTVWREWNPDGFWARVDPSWVPASVVEEWKKL